MSKRKLFGLLALGLCALPAAASANIVPGESIGGVKLGMTVSQVGKVLGHGKKVFGSSLYDYRHDRYEVIFKHGHAVSIETSSSHERASNGVGVGTTISRLHKLEPRVFCRNYNPSPGGIDCFLKGAHRYTDFVSQANKRVTSVFLVKGSPTANLP